MASTSPETVSEYIAVLRHEYVCDRCKKYVGSLSQRRYLPPPYPVALGQLGDDEVEALIGFEWYMLQRLKQGNFTIRHPQRRRRCVSMKEWLAEQEDDTE